jgi:peptidoglycan/LPS O-acetylase OafA/YrhL
MKLGSIQFLRAIAVLLVAYAHSIDLQMGYAHSFQQDFFYWQNFGAFGVDIFFVISGFIITYSAGTYKGGREGALFLAKRFKRVNPVYYLATLVFISTFIHAIFVGKAPAPAFPFIVKSILLLPLFDKTAFINTILFPAWTLSFEWLFYGLFFLTILSRTRYKERALLLLITALVLAGVLFKGMDYRLRFTTNPILLEFLLGVCLYGCYTKIRVPKKMAFALLLTGSGICLYEIIKGFGDISEATNILDGSLSLSRFVQWGIPAGLLVAGCIFLEKRQSLGVLWNSKLIGLLGDASYSIYLVNNTVYEGCRGVYKRTGFFLHLDRTIPDLMIILQWLLAIAGGLIFYRLVEVPLLRLLRRRPSSMPQAA